MLKFSVLLSIYDKDTPKFLQEALDSIINQKLPPNEIVLVEDGPLSDALKKVVDHFCSTHNGIVKRVVLPINKGLGAALNEGLKHCSYEYIARMDTDDISRPDRFLKQIAFFEQFPDLSVVGGYIEEFNESPGDLNRIKKVPLSSKSIHESIAKRNPMNHPSVMFKKKDVESCGSYEDVGYFEDYYLWFKLNKQSYKMANTGDILLDFRIGNDMIGRRHGWSYMLKELKFIRKSLANELITAKEAFMMALFRLPIRIMPKIIISGVYRFLLR